MSQSRKLAAVMFTDIVGYTALMGNDEQKAFELLRKNREIQKPIIEEFDGRWIKELGDGVMATFPAVSNAVYAAIKIQEACFNTKAFQLRIGIHQGEVVFENDDIFGDAVNIASRLQALALPGSIFVSGSVQRDISNKNDIRSEFVRSENLKNVKEPVGVYQIFSGANEKTETETRPVTKSSILPGFDYDIYISYRYNDNKYDGWVTEFAEKLNQELGSTLKDKLTIFIDKNPEDGSKTAKVQSLIFIPIVSQTYCDTNSAVWKNEFKVFLDEIKSDPLGSSMRVNTGNDVSRMIPVKIHEIDTEDVKLLESELSGSLRSINFIYREEGVNRPLRPPDDEKPGNPNRPMYRNQINKLANAIKEIITGIKLNQKGSSGKEPSSYEPTARQMVPNIVVTAVSSAIKVQVIDRQRPNIYLAWTSGDLKESREEMAIILQKAGFNVLPSVDCPADDEVFKEKVAAEMQKCVCSLHMLSGEFGRRFERDEETSFPQHQFMEAKKKIDEKAAFNIFVWLAPEAGTSIKPAQQNFIKYIRNNITRNMMFSNSQGPMQLVDDMRVVMMKQDAKVYDSKDTDIYFIFNQQDEQEARVIVDELSLEFPVETLNISPEGEESYREMSSQQIPKSKLAVVYFKYAADWALPFIKQIWKQVGGASSPTPMFLVGENDPQSNLARNFKAPRVKSSIVPKETIPSEVKKVYNELN